MWKRMVAVFVCFCLGFTFLYVKLLSISTNEEYAQIARTQTGYTLSLGRTYGTIYDHNFTPLVENYKRYMAAVYPTEESLAALREIAVDKRALEGKKVGGVPFVCEVKTDKSSSSDITIVPVSKRYSPAQIATHIIGYTSDGKGVSGLELAFDELLRGEYNESAVTYRMDSKLELIKGKEVVTVTAPRVSTGVVTTLDADIQRICEVAAAKYMKKGAVVVMEPFTGELRAVVSMPTFDVENLAKSLVDTENTPMINRALHAYSLGLIFKLCTAASALEQGISPTLEHDCLGGIDIGGQHFRCHNLAGHGVLDMEGAIVESCNTYFIHLSTLVDGTAFLRTASAFSFGKGQYLTSNIRTQAGYLQTPSDLVNIAEVANLSFGQGKLTATPIQVAQMTSSIVNGGNTPQAQLVLGITEDGINVSKTLSEPAYTKAISEETAALLRKYMRSMVLEETKVGVRPDTTTAGGKTATAQTGKFNEKGDEIIQGWFTGFTPAYEPKYVITVLVEDGGSGYTSAGPIFKYIADELKRLGK